MPNALFPRPLSPTRVSVLLTCIGLAAAGLAPAAHAQLTLTGMTMYNSTSTGQFNGGYWNTVGGDGAYDVYLYTGSDATPSFINKGDSAGVSPSYTLASGTNTVNFVGTTSPSQYFGINLYFNNATAPNISALVQSGVSGFSVIGPGTSTYGLPSTSVPGSGSLSFFAGGSTVTLSSLNIANANISGVDLVSAFNNVADGSADNRGTMTLSVTGAASAPEPGSLVFLALGVSGSLPVVGVIARRRRNVA